MATYNTEYENMRNDNIKANDFNEAFEDVDDYENNKEVECVDDNCETFEDVSEDSENNTEEFTSTESKDMELWTCYPSNKKEDFENSSGSTIYSALVNYNDDDMGKLYMYLAIAIIILIILYLLRK